MAAPTPNLQLSRPDDGDPDWGGEYRTTMDVLDLHAHDEDGIPIPGGQAGLRERQFDWTTVGGQSVPAYIGIATEGTLVGQAAWKVSRYTWATDANGDPIVTRIDEAIGAWTDRAAMF